MLYSRSQFELGEGVDEPRVDHSRSFGQSNLWDFKVFCREIFIHLLLKEGVSYVSAFFQSF